MTATHWTDLFFCDLYYRFDLLNDEDLEIQLKCLEQFCNPIHGRLIADMACGYGRLVVPLSSRSDALFVGIDKSDLMLDIAENRSRNHLKKVTFKHLDLVCPSNPTCLYDAAYMFGTSFGYYADDESNLMILKNIHNMLKKDGVFVFQQTNIPQNLHIIKNDDEYEFKKESSFDQISCIYRGSYYYLNKLTKEFHEYPFKIKLYRKSDLVRLFELAQFRIEAVFGSYDLTTFDEKSPMLMIKAIT
jgi:SAM-dependent methyltransferase